MKIIKDEYKEKKRELRQRTEIKWERDIIFSDAGFEDIIPLFKKTAAEYEALLYYFSITVLEEKRLIDKEKINVEKDGVWAYHWYDICFPPKTELLDVALSFPEFEDRFDGELYKRLKRVSFQGYGKEWNFSGTLDAEHGYFELESTRNRLLDRDYYLGKYGEVVRNVGVDLDEWDNALQKWSRLYGDHSYAREIWLGQGDNCLKDISEEEAKRKCIMNGGDFYDYEDGLYEEIIEKEKKLQGGKKMSIENIGTHISEARKKVGLTQDELAEAVGVSAQAVSKWENGWNLPDIENL